MDPPTLAALDTEFGGITGFDVLATPLEGHHRDREAAAGNSGSGGGGAGAAGAPQQARKPGPWPAKVLALLRCSFRHVLLLDSDSLPLAEPARLFEDHLYQQKGALF